MTEDAWSVSAIRPEDEHLAAEVDAWVRWRMQNDPDFARRMNDALSRVGARVLERFKDGE